MNLKMLHWVKEKTTDQMIYLTAHPEKADPEAESRSEVVGRKGMGGDAFELWCWRRFLRAP